MAYCRAAKGEGVLKNAVWVRDFANDLMTCVSKACSVTGQEISNLELGAYGTTNRITKTDVGSGGTAATDFSTSVVASHANAYARHFLSAYHGKTTRMDLGNLVEQLANYYLVTDFPRWEVGKHYLYQQSKTSVPRFPVNFVGASKSGRPDFRLELYSISESPCEAVFDITTPGEMNHVLKKATSNGTIATCDAIPVAVEVIWEDADLWKN